jgi:hypothetical protein
MVIGVERVVRVVRRWQHVCLVADYCPSQLSFFTKKVPSKCHLRGGVDVLVALVST